MKLTLMDEGCIECKGRPPIVWLLARVVTAKFERKEKVLPSLKKEETCM